MGSPPFWISLQYLYFSEDRFFADTMISVIEAHLRLIGDALLNEHIYCRNKIAGSNDPEFYYIENV
jgi:hypothetical protein